MIKASIIGGAGYTAGELIRLLVQHPEAELISVVSKSHEGAKVTEAHPDLIGESELLFSTMVAEETEVVFLCSGHGNSSNILQDMLLPKSVRIIDLSADFRLQNQHHSFVYGLPELQKERISNAENVANPGCFATAIQLALLPLAYHNELKNAVHVHAITGSTGAGQQPTATTHFSWRNNNASVYKAFEHQHLGEIRQSLVRLQSNFTEALHFIPMRGAFTRGILATCYLKTSLTETEAKEQFSQYYASHPFVHLSEHSPDIKQVVNTNKNVLNIRKMGDQLLITSVIDNLLKGASGQAIQNMNLMFGLKETTGLTLKSSVF